MSTTPVFLKDPEAVLDFGVDWADWLVDDTIATSTWTVPEGITLDSASATDTLATAWLSGGVNGSDYQLVNRVVTAGGRTDERTITIQVRNR